MIKPFVLQPMSVSLYQKALGLIPGGVNSPVRAWKAVGGTPTFIASGLGSEVFDVDGNRYIDYLAAWGPLILGHSHPRVIAAVERAARAGLSFGAPMREEVEAAEIICLALPSIEKLRLVSSGTEAAMTAVRIARAFTGRKKLLKLEGCYHGHADPFLVQSGSGGLTLSLSGSSGVPEETVNLTVVARFNSPESIETTIWVHRGEIAALIIEPVCGNCGVIPPEPGFLEWTRKITAEENIVLIFDEVITGFRIAWGGAQTLYGVVPDLTCLGKVIGGGLPIGAVGGRAELMDLLAPEGSVYQAGTNSGNPVAVAAGLATLRELHDTQPYRALDALGARLERGLLNASQESAVPARVNRIGSMFWLFFGDCPVVDARGACQVNRALYARFFHAMMSRGVYFPPSPLESCFISTRHTDEDVERTLEAARSSFLDMRDALEDC
jgi:glutamate-1-semialdehyde 2,1-aminomutase